ncbi:pilus assembly protein [Microbacterium sp. W1N]|uniref:TadE family protein n=1 Tax=Microbacterium festucae TaxID=2977531 RepID=UPI0021BF77E4|nr:TadE/TadG family type IV pilus assembly protein [Microbacterium festucae]MCT9820397.1 pilus assembly protein [Microbacterium festucae]
MPRSRRPQGAAEDAGSSTVEFVLVGSMLTILTLAVLQFALAVYVRNVVHDAAVDGAYHAALADVSLEEGAARTRQIIERTVGAGFVAEVAIADAGAPGAATIEVTVTATLPLVGLLGAPRGWEVSAHAPAESFD